MSSGLSACKHSSHNEPQLSWHCQGSALPPPAATNSPYHKPPQGRGESPRLCLALRCYSPICSCSLLKGSGEQSSSAPKMILASAAHLDVEGPGARYDFKEVVSHQEVTRNREEETVTPQQPPWTEKPEFIIISGACWGGMYWRQTLALRRVQIPRELQPQTPALPSASSPPQPTAFPAHVNYQLAVTY